MKEILIKVPDNYEIIREDEKITVLAKKQSVIKRIQTFDDACKEIGYQDPLVLSFKAFLYTGIKDNNLLAYLKLRIITKALNEGWEPTLKPDEHRYYPWFRFFTEDQYKNLSEVEKECCVLRSGYGTFSFVGFVCRSSNVDGSFSFINFGSLLSYKTEELAKYSAKKFIRLWEQYLT